MEKDTSGVLWRSPGWPPRLLSQEQTESFFQQTHGSNTCAASLPRDAHVRHRV